MKSRTTCDIVKLCKDKSLEAQNIILLDAGSSYRQAQVSCDEQGRSRHSPALGVAMVAPWMGRSDNAEVPS